MDIKFKDNSQLKLIPFTQLEYIESTGTQYIDTGIKLTEKISFDLEYKLNVVDQSKWFFGSATSHNGQGIFISNYGNGIFVVTGKTGKREYTIGGKDTNKHIIKYTPSLLSFDGNNIQLANNTFTSGTNCIAFGCYNGSTLNTQSQRIYALTFYNEYNVVLANFIPCKTKSNVVCFYDTISNTYFYNQGTGDFIAGPVVPFTENTLPKTILLKTTTLYHKNTPNIDGLSLLNSILNYQKTHQDEIKEYYYTTTQLWQDIITEYPDIVQYYNTNHKLCIPICEADDPAQFTEDLLQAIEDYPDITDVIIDNPEVVHSLVDTGYETVLTSSGTQYIDTGIKPSNTLEVNCGFEFISIPQGNCGTPFSSDDGSYTTNGFGLIPNGANNELTFGYGNEQSSFIQCTTGVLYNVIIKNGLQQIKTNNTIVQTRNITKTFNTSSNLTLFACNRNNNIVSYSSIKLHEFKIYNNDNLVRWLVPIQNNDNPCMIDLLTGTKYLNQGTGNFTYSLEPKNV